MAADSAEDFCAVPAAHAAAAVRRPPFPIPASSPASAPIAPGASSLPSGDDGSAETHWGLTTTSWIVIGAALVLAGGIFTVSQLSTQSSDVTINVIH
jgi:hypothetical protein